MKTTKDLPPVVIRDLRPGDWPEVARIYGAGIATRNATFETDVPSWEEWNASHLLGQRFVALGDTSGPASGSASSMGPGGTSCCSSAEADLTASKDSRYGGSGAIGRLPGLGVNRRARSPYSLARALRLRRLPLVARRSRPGPRAVP